MHEDDDFEEQPLIDQTDHDILMHREVHFGGSFAKMIDYYLHEGKGAMQEFSIDRILYLAQVEEALETNLAGQLLTGPEAEQVAMAGQAYDKMRALESAPPELSLLAELVLSEEDYPEEVIEKIVQEGAKMVPGLLHLLQSSDFVDPLYPGYGLAREYAAIALGKIGDERAIIPLFESLRKQGFFEEEGALEALQKIGEPAKSFLIKRLGARPLVEDNERAAMALTYFDDSEVALFCLEQLHDPAVYHHLQLALYLVLACAGLEKVEDRKRLQALLEVPTMPHPIHEEIRLLLKSWH